MWSHYFSINKYTFRTVKHPSEFRLVFGNIYRNQSSKYLLERDVSIISVLRSFDIETGAHDVAILKFPKQISARANGINPIALRNESTIPNTICTVTGWNSDASENLNSHILHVANLSSTDIQHCRTDTHNKRSDFICFTAMGNQRICGGYDTGSPVVCDNELVGFISLEENCENVSKHVVVTSIADHFEWIRTNGSSFSTVNYVLLVLSSLPALVRLPG